MKAPDKIYINNYNGNDTWGNQWHTKPAIDPVTISHEYIRKNALLEWANSEMSREQGYTTEDAECAYRHALQDLVTKLNSM